MMKSERMCWGLSISSLGIILFGNRKFFRGIQVSDSKFHVLLFKKNKTNCGILNGNSVAMHRLVLHVLRGN